MTSAMGEREVRGDPFITFTPRGGGGLEKWPIMRTIVLIGYVKMRTGGGGGPKSQKFCERNKWMPPYVIYRNNGMLASTSLSDVSPKCQHSNE